MTRLQHSDVTQGQRSAPDKARAFHTLGVTPFVSRVMLGTALTFGGAALGGGAAISCLLTSRVAMAQEETQEIGGKRIKVVKLDKTLAEMQRENRRNGIHTTEAVLGSNPAFRVYSYVVVGPDIPTFMVVLDHKNVYGRDYEKTIDAMPAGYRIGDPNAPTKTINLTNFAKYVLDTFGSTMIRVNVILGTGTFTNEQGEHVTYTQAHVFPLDASGNVISRLGDGQYVAFVATQYQDVYVGGTVVVSEPGNKDTLARK